MTQATQTARIVNLLMDMLDADDRQLVLQQIGKEQGFKVDIARLYSDRDVAERYGVHVRTAREWISSGKVKGCQIDRKWYSRADWLEEFERKSAEQAQ